MLRSSFGVGVVLAVSASCGPGTVTEEPQRPPAPQAGAPAVPEHPTDVAAVVPENAEDRGIRRNLSLAIAQDPSLKERQISFLVSNGDVSVTGVVDTEGERKKVNELAMGITGVKSVANALRISQ